MSAITRFAPILAKSAVYNPSRHMATATSSDPIQKLFVDKIKEFKSTNQGLDSTHQKAMAEEMNRLKRVYKLEDESKLSQFDFKFSSESNVSLHDIDTSKDMRKSISTGEYHKQLVSAPPERSELIESTPDQTRLEFHLPTMNKPDVAMLIERTKPLSPAQLGTPSPDYDFVGEKMTPHRLQRDLRVMFGPEMPTIHDDKKPDRDVVNFPRLNIVDQPPPTRFHFIPESWFKFFYPKTGVTGPYTFAGALSTFLLSKEWVVWEHELLTGVTTTIIFTYAVIKYGPKITAYTNKAIADEEDGWENWRTGNIKTLEQLQEHYKKELKKNDVLDHLYAIRHNDVDMQLEHEYRKRIESVYNDTKRRLNYLVSVADSQRQIAHKNMVNWVITNSISSIGQKQENEVLENCVANLKQLGMKYSNAI